jgi:hypothetical protein
MKTFLALVVVGLLVAGTYGSGGHSGGWERCNTKEDDGNSSLDGWIRSTFHTCKYARNTDIDVRLEGDFYGSLQVSPFTNNARVFVDGPGDCDRSTRPDIDHNGYVGEWEVRIYWCDTDPERSYFHVWGRETSSQYNYFWTDIGYMVAEEDNN